MGNVALAAEMEIVNAPNLGAQRQQPIAQMAADETRRSGDQYMCQENLPSVQTKKSSSPSLRFDLIQRHAHSVAQQRPGMRHFAGNDGVGHGELRRPDPLYLHGLQIALRYRSEEHTSELQSHS